MTKLRFGKTNVFENAKEAEVHVRFANFFKAFWRRNRKKGQNWLHCFANLR